MAFIIVFRQLSIKNTFIPVMLLTLLFQSCSKTYEIVEEKEVSRVKLTPVEVKPGREMQFPGITISGQIKGMHFYNSAYYLVVRVLDKEGNPVKHTFTAEELAAEPDNRNIPYYDSLAPVRRPAERELTWVMARDSGDFPEPNWKVLVPYQWLPFTVGSAGNTFRVEVNGYMGQAKDFTPLSDYITDPPKEVQQDAHLVMNVFTDMPTVHKARWFIKTIEVDEEQADPHSWDFSLNGNSGSAGYPDLMWELRVDDKLTFESEVYKNTLAANFTDKHTYFWYTGESPKFAVCILDWDNENLFNNQHDELGCWKGEGSGVSGDSLQPTTVRTKGVKYLEMWWEKN